MKKFVCESLNSFLHLNENMEEAKKAFDETGYGEYWEKFKEKFGRDPEFMGQFAKWITSGDENLLKRISKKIEATYLSAKENKININPQGFQDFYSYRDAVEDAIFDKGEISKEVQLENKETKNEKNSKEELKEKIDQEFQVNVKQEKNHFSEQDIKKLKDWFFECKMNQEKNGFGSIPEKYISKIGGISDSDIKNKNCEADYIWAEWNMFIGRLELGLQPIIKSGSASRTGNPFETIAHTAKRGTPGEKIVLAVFYAPKRLQDTSDLDDKYHPIMKRNSEILFKEVEDEKGKKGGAGTEMFYIDYNPNIIQIKADAISEVLNLDKSKGSKKLNPNTLQENPSKEILEKIKSLGSNKALTIFLGYKCRFPGKTITVLWSFNKSNTKFLLVFSRRKNIAESWERNSQFFPDIIYISLSDFINLSNIDESKKYLIVGTVQSLEKRAGEEGEENDFPEESFESENPEEAIENEKLEEYFNNFLEKIKSNKFWIALDEAHQGGIAKNTADILRKFSENSQCEVRWDVSGTGLKLFKKKDYDLEYHYDIINEENDRSEYIKKLGLTYDHSKLPFLPDSEKKWIDKINSIDFDQDPNARVVKSPKKVTYVMTDSIVDSRERKRIQSIGNNPGIPPMKHLLSKDEHGARFPYSVNNSIDWVLGEGVYKDPENEKKYNTGFINQENKSYLENWGFMIFTSLIMNGEVLSESFKRYGYVDVINICGRYLSQEDINLKIMHSLMQKRKPIIISCGSHGEGSDFEQIIATFHFDNGTSGENKTQRGFRGATPFMGKVRPGSEPIFKTVHFDVYFDMSQALKIAADEIIKTQKDSGEDLSEVIKKYRNANPLYETGLKKEEIDSKLYQEKIREEINSNKIKKSIINEEFNFLDIPENFLQNVNKDLLKGIDKSVWLGKKDKKSKGDSNKKDLDKEKEGDKEEDKNKDDRETFKIFLENIIQALSAFTTRPYFTLNNISSIEEVFENMDEKSFINNLGISKDFYKKLIEKGIFNLEGLNYFLSTRPKLITSDKFKNYNLDKILSDALEETKKAEPDPFDMFVGTNNKLIGEIKEKIYPIIKKRGSYETLKILDPELKNGEFILLALQIMNDLLKEKIPSERERIQKIIDNHIYGFSSEKTNVEGFFLLLAEIFKNFDLDFTKLKDNILHINTIEEIKRKDMKFDIVIGNPPFQPFGSGGTGNKIWQKFIEIGFESLKDNGIISMITPNHWRILKSERGVHREAQRLMWDNKILFIKPVNEYFKVGGMVQMDYWIISKDKNLKGIEIPPILQKFMFIPEKMDKRIIEYFEEIDKGNNFVMDIGKNDYRDPRYEVSKKSKNKPSEKYPYPHINTFPQFEDGFFDWYSKKTKGFNDKKVMISLTRSPKRRVFYDKDGKYGCGHKTHAYSINNDQEGEQLENFLNNSEIIKILEDEGKHGFAIPLKLFYRVPKSFIQKFNNDRVRK